jgi:NADH dehydrogenase [ubiquinone] 1 alpha subcomplex assembly factor 1
MKASLLLFAILLSSIVLADNRVEFDNPDASQWMIVNDSVMGGRSDSNIVIDQGIAQFTGTVSLENYGGFASARLRLDDTNTQTNRLRIRLKGDGSRYKVRARTSNNWGGPAYSFDFDTTGEWQELVVFPDDLKLMFRGRVFKRFTEVNFSEVSQLGFMIADKQTGDFKLLIDWIKFDSIDSK